MIDIRRAAWFIHESNAIEEEGDLSRNEIRHLLRRQSERGHVGAFLHLLGVAAKNALPRKVDLFHAHGLLMREQYAAEGGETRGKDIGNWRSGQVYVGDDVPPPAVAVPALMDDLVRGTFAFADKPYDKEAAVDLVADAHHAFLKVHPFMDGNGRTSRMYANALLVRFGLPLAVFTANDRHDSYYPACSLSDSRLMRTYLRSKIAQPNRQLTLSGTKGWHETLPEHLKR